MLSDLIEIALGASLLVFKYEWRPTWLDKSELFNSTLRKNGSEEVS